MEAPSGWFIYLLYIVNGLHLALDLTQHCLAEAQHIIGDYNKALDSLIM